MAPQRPPALSPLDVLSGMLDGALLQTAKVFREASKRDAKDLIQTSTQLRNIMPGLDMRFQNALDELELEILRAKAVIERDLVDAQAAEEPPTPAPAQEIEQKAEPETKAASPDKTEDLQLEAKQPESGTETKSDAKAEAETTKEETPATITATTQQDNPPTSTAIAATTTELDSLFADPTVGKGDRNADFNFNLTAEDKGEGGEPGEGQKKDELSAESVEEILPGLRSWANAPAGNDTGTGTGEGDAPADRGTDGNDTTANANGGEDIFANLDLNMDLGLDMPVSGAAGVTNAEGATTTDTAGAMDLLPDASNFDDLFGMDSGDAGAAGNAAGEGGVEFNLDGIGDLENAGQGQGQGQGEFDDWMNFGN